MAGSFASGSNENLLRGISYDVKSSSRFAVDDLVSSLDLQETLWILDFLEHGQRSAPVFKLVGMD